MSRILVTALPAPSHVNQMLLVGREIKALGHKVLFAGSPTYRHSAEQSGANFIQAGLSEFPETDIAAPTGFASREQSAISDLARATYFDLLPLLEKDPPDLIVRDFSERGAYLASEVLDIPAITVCLTGTSNAKYDIDDNHWVNKLRRSVGLQPIGSTEAQSPLASICRRPREFHGTDALLDSCKFVQASETDHSGPKVLPHGSSDEPHLVVTLGTIIPRRHPQLYQSVLTALSHLSLRVVALNVPPEFAFIDGITSTGYVDQQAAFRDAAAVIHHAGMNSVCDSIVAGVPMICMPTFDDQFYNASRCAQVGVGIVSKHDTATARTSVVDDVMALLSDLKSYTDEIHHLQAANNSCPSLRSTLKSLLTSLA